MTTNRAPYDGEVPLPVLGSLPRPARLALRWLVSVGVLVAVGLALRGRFTSVAEAGVPWPAAWAVVVTAAVFVLANEVLVRAWLGLVHMGRARIHRRLGRWVWAKSQLARYAVGMAQVASRALIARQHGMSPATGAVTTLLEVVWFACISGAIAVATIPWWLPDTGLAWAAWFAVLPGLVILLSLVRPQAFVGIAVLLSRIPLVRRLPKLERARDLEVSHGETAVITGYLVLNALLRIAGFYALYLGVGGPSGQLLRVAGAFVLGHLIGAVAVFAPGGFGPREGVTALALAPVLGSGPVLMLVGATRLLELLGELGYAGFARWRWSRHAPIHPQQADEAPTPSVHVSLDRATG